MTLTLNLPQDLKDRLQQEAERQRLPVDTLILHLLDQHLPSKDIQEKLAALLRSWIVEGDSQEQKETGEYLVRALDEDRLSERPLFPRSSRAGPSDPTGRENGAQGRGRRPMPWVKRLTTRCGLKGRETVGPAIEASVGKPVVRALEVADDIA